MLLTGSSLDKEVIEAFNNNFIDKFIIIFLVEIFSIKT